jgi:hypothetical protein
MKKELLIITLTALVFATHAQEFEIKRYELAGDNIVIFYDLVDTVKNRSYTINLYASKDNYLNPLTKISGDVGLEVKPGTNRKLTWNAKEELGNTFAGKVAIEIRGRVYIPFVRFGSFEDIESRKRGVPFVVTWTGGTRQNILNFDLYSGDKKVWTQANVANNGNYELEIPTSVKPGKDFRFKISDSKNKDEIVYTPTFAVKRKIPLLLKVVPLVALAGVVGIFATQGSSSTEGPTVPGEIPDIIKPD